MDRTPQYNLTPVCVGGNPVFLRGNGETDWIEEVHTTAAEALQVERPKIVNVPEIDLARDGPFLHRLNAVFRHFRSSRIRNGGPRGSCGRRKMMGADKAQRPRPFSWKLTDTLVSADNPQRTKEVWCPPRHAVDGLNGESRDYDSCAVTPFEEKER